MSTTVQHAYVKPKRFSDPDYRTLSRVYSPLQVGLAAFFAGPLAAGTLLALNHLKFRKTGAAAAVALVSILVFAGALTLGILTGPFAPIVGLVIGIFNIVGFSSYAKARWKHMYEISIPQKFSRTPNRLMAVMIIGSWVVFGAILQITAVALSQGI